MTITPERLAEIRKIASAIAGFTFPNYLEGIGEIEDAYVSGFEAAEPEEKVDAIRDLLAELDAMAADNERLSLMAQGKFMDANRVLRMGPGDDGTFEIVLATPIFQTFCGLFTEMFKRSGAKNYIDQHIHHDVLGELLITIQRVDGKTAHQLREEAERERDAALAKVARMSNL